MSWIKDVTYTWLESFAINIVKMGPIPRHIAFIMDGNRRYAQSSNIDKIEGHSQGFQKLTECLRWCLDIGVKEVTTFAFSIENFKRSKDEVTALMALAKTKFESLIQEEENLRREGIRINIIGNISLLPKEIQTLAAKSMIITEENNKLFLNIAFAYTSREEMSNALLSILQEGDDLPVTEISDDLLNKCLYTKDCNDPDLLIRTSGETRISDFLMWQISSTALYFTKVFWPAITLWNFLYGIFQYQCWKAWSTNFSMIPRNNVKEINDCSTSESVQNFIRRLEKRRRDYLYSLASNKPIGD